MDPWYAKIVVLVAAGLIGAIRALQTSRRGAASVAARAGGIGDRAAMAASFLGFVVPVLWTAVPWFAAADYPLRPAALGAGVGVMGLGLWVFHRTHVDLSTNWSATLQIRESHALVTTGLYSRIRHPMYLALLLYGVGQAFVIPNGIAAAACLLGNVVLVAARIGPEERMMRATFGAAYDAWVRRTHRLVPGVW
jgi:protein-S-isoprenylcysteine O-methyltransferase Ste14